MPTLTSLLARDAVVPIELIERALQRQVLEGDEIDAALLELGAVTENVLSAYRAAAFGLPPVASAELERVDPGLLALLPTDIACTLRVVPIALHDNTLELASAWPLSQDEGVALSERLGKSIRVRIANEPRIRLALSQHYGAELTGRLRLLSERLMSQDQGELCDVRGSASMPAARSFSPTISPSTQPDLRGSLGPAPRAASPSSSQMQAVRVVPFVRLGSEANVPPADDDTRPARPSKMPPMMPQQVRPPEPNKRISSPPAGPLTRQQTVKMLAAAHDRDRVLEIFFSFARQYFECTVLFAVRDERLLGLDASGLPSVEQLRAVEVPFGRDGKVPSNILNVVLSRKPQILTLQGGDADRMLVTAIDREQAQPCALIPIVIRQRIVSLLYGDRGGESLLLTELSELIDILPAIGAAFERIIHERKLQAIDARRERHSQAPAAQPRATDTFHRPSAAPPSADATLRGHDAPTQNELSRSTGARGPRASRTPTPNARSPMHASQGAQRGIVPPPPRLPIDAAQLSGESDVTMRPTIQFPSDAISRELQRPSDRPPSAGGYSHHDQLATRARRRNRTIDTPPGRRSSAPAAPTRAPVPAAAASAHDPELHALLASGRTLDPPPPRTFSQPPPGAGSYAMHGALGESLDRPSKRPKAARQASVAPSVVGPRAQAELLVEKLCQCGPDDEQPLVDALLPLGDVALQALAARFPGPLWVDRNKTRQSSLAGRDISAIARAMYAFEDRAVPHLAELMLAPRAETRLCAIVLATQHVCAELLQPIYKCLFDPEAQVRMQAAAALPLFRNVKAFGETRAMLRKKAAAEVEPIAGRQAALEAISVLRDAGSIEVLAKLCTHPTRQLSVPAHRALMAITAQDFGDADKKWRAWFSKNKEHHRAEWLIDSLMHPDERMRSIASLELQKLTQIYHGYSANAGKREREQAQRRYRDWWESEGRKLFDT